MLGLGTDLGIDVVPHVACAHHSLVDAFFPLRLRPQVIVINYGLEHIDLYFFKKSYKIAFLVVLKKCCKIMFWVCFFDQKYLKNAIL